MARRLQWRLEAFGFDVASTALRALPIDVASSLGGRLFSWFGPLTSWDRTIRRNLVLAFPEASAKERSRIRMAHWEQFGRLSFEFVMMDRLTLESGRIELAGGETLRALARERRAAVLISGHFSNFEVMAAAIIGSGLRCTISYGPLENPHLNRRIIRCRKRYGLVSLAETGFEGARKMVRALANGDAVAMLIDQNLDDGVPAPFLGCMASSHPGAARLAQNAGGQVIPLTVQRLRGARFRVTVHEPIRLAKARGDRAELEANVRRLNRFIEDRIRQQPHDWFWSHRRWPALMDERRT